MDYNLIKRAQLVLVKQSNPILKAMGRQALKGAGVGAASGAVGSYMGGGDILGGALQGAVLGGALGAAGGAGGAGIRGKAQVQGKAILNRPGTYGANGMLRKYRGNPGKSGTPYNLKIDPNAGAPPGLANVKADYALANRIGKYTPYAAGVGAAGLGYMTASPEAISTPQIQAYGSANFLEPDFIEKQAQIRMFRASNRGN